MQDLLTSIRLVLATMLVCVAGYSAVIWGIGEIFVPSTAHGSLVTRADGTTVGSSLVAQKSNQPGYFWPRPSAVDYNASAAGGSNKSPTSTDLTDRAREIISLYGATVDNPLPAELAAASGSGLDPHISEHAALYQARRVAQARGLSIYEVESIIRQQSSTPGGFLTPNRLVNVLELNLALDRLAAAQ
jgi:K+-transporting ATPase ATPase C chain